MAVPVNIGDLSTTAASNGPSGTSEYISVGDDYLRAHASFIAGLNSSKAPKASPTFSGTASFGDVSFAGALSGTNVHNPSVSTGAQYICSGTYTPTGAGVANVDSITTYSSHWMRVGNVVTVSGYVAITATTADISTTATITIPIPSEFTTFRQLSGAGSTGESPVRISAETTDDVARLFFYPTSTASKDVSFHFTYVVL